MEQKMNIEKYLYNRLLLWSDELNRFRHSLYIYYNETSPSHEQFEFLGLLLRIKSE